MNSPSDKSPVIWGGPCIGSKMEPAGMVMQKGCNTFSTLVERCFDVARNSIRGGEFDVRTTCCEKLTEFAILDNVCRSVIFGDPLDNACTGV